MRERVLYQDRDHAIEPHGQVVALAPFLLRTRELLRLNEHHVGVHVGRHIGGDGEGVAGLLRVQVHPNGIEHAAAGLQAHQRTAGASAGDDERAVVAYLILLLVGIEAEHGGLVGILPAAAAFPSGPIHVHLHGAGVAARGIGDADGEAAPLRPVDAELEGRPALRIGGEFLLLLQFNARRSDVAGRTGDAAIPPPVVIQLVHLRLQLVLRDGLALGIDACDAELVAGVGGVGAPVVARFGRLDAHVAGVGVVGHAHTVHAGIAAGLEYAGHDVGLHHRGRASAHVQVEVELGFALLIQVALEGHLLLIGHPGAQVVELVLVVALEIGPAVSHGHRYAALQVLGGRAMQPVRAQLDARIAIGAEALAFSSAGPIGEIKQHLEAVGLHRLDAQALVEGGAAHAHHGVPVAGGRIGQGGAAEGIHAVHAGGSHVLLIQPPARIADLQHHGMVLRQGVLRVLQHEAQVERITGTPHAALAVEEALQAFLNRFALHVVAAHAQ